MNTMWTAPTTRSGRILVALAMALVIALAGMALTTLLFRQHASFLTGAVTFVLLFVAFAWRAERNT